VSAFRRTGDVRLKPDTTYDNRFCAKHEWGTSKGDVKAPWIERTPPREARTQPLERRRAPWTLRYACWIRRCASWVVRSCAIELSAYARKTVCVQKKRRRALRIEWKANRIEPESRRIEAEITSEAPGGRLQRAGARRLGCRSARRPTVARCRPGGALRRATESASESPWPVPGRPQAASQSW
jgi:hypothetical protein